MKTEEQKKEEILSFNMEMAYGKSHRVNCPKGHTLPFLIYPAMDCRTWLKCETCNEEYLLGKCFTIGGV